MLTLPSSYQFTPKDLQGSALAWKRVRRQANGNQAVFSFLQESDFGRIPDDRVWLITQVTAQGTTVNPEFWANAFFTENGPIELGGQPLGLIAHASAFSFGSAPIDGETIECNYIVQGKNHVRAFANFSSGVPNNIIILDVAGWLIPRANIEFAGSN